VFAVDNLENVGHKREVPALAPDREPDPNSERRPTFAGPLVGERQEDLKTNQCPVNSFVAVPVEQRRPDGPRSIEDAADARDLGKIERVVEHGFRVCEVYPDVQRHVAEN
jgi:hypothetical protein